MVVDVKTLLEDLRKLRLNQDTCSSGSILARGGCSGEVPAGVARASIFDLRSENNRVDLRSDNNRVGAMEYSGL